MVALITHPPFSTLLSHNKALNLVQKLEPLVSSRYDCPPSTSNSTWTDYRPIISLQQSAPANDEQSATNSLIELFNLLFAKQQVQLVRGIDEPEYFPASKGRPARIEFAHGFFASALHEISHWCIAGTARRQLPDFGYWYAPDGRTEMQQRAFERLEIKPQALECLFTLACRRPFQVSQDNLFASFDTSCSTFPQDVYQQALDYVDNPKHIPYDAQVLLYALLNIALAQQKSQ